MTPTSAYWLSMAIGLLLTLGIITTSTLAMRYLLRLVQLKKSEKHHAN